MISCLASATAPLAPVTRPSASSARASISVEAMVAPLAGVSASPWIAVTFSPIDSTVFEASPIFPCNTSLSSASLFSLASLAAFLSPSMTFSRAMPRDTLSFWKFAFLTPLSPSSSKHFSITSREGAGTVRLNSPLAYLMTSFWLSMPSLSASYLSNTAIAPCNFFCASALRTDLLFASLDVATMASLLRVYSLILCRSLAIACLVAGAGCPGRSGTLISGPLASRKSVHAFSLSFAPWLASSTAFHVAVTSSSASSLPLERGSASSLSAAEAFSAPATRSSSSLTSCSARSRASFRFFSASSLCSSAFRCCSFSISMR
mmetsp:Transcript_51336/g.159138  ORF Transcript_51336/g.159138 Transcript_51336/m.159138 type:complete len:319 (+) Transcript_51336:1364-2320(+)